MQPLLIATGNPGKFLEMATVLEGLPFQLTSLVDLGEGVTQVDENGTTHEENARLKARFFGEQTGFLTLGEDSGLEVDALRGELGIHTRRWGAGDSATDEEWLTYFLKRMEEVSAPERTARFVCCAVLSMPDGTEHMFVGETRGTITFCQEAPILKGLPLSSVFQPEGYGRVYAALTPEEKAKISHRGLAVGQVKTFLEQQGF